MSKNVKNWTYPNDFKDWVKAAEWANPSGNHYMAFVKMGTTLSAVIHKEDNDVVSVFDGLTPIYIGLTTKEGIGKVQELLKVRKYKF